MTLRMETIRDRGLAVCEALARPGLLPPLIALPGTLLLFSLNSAFFRSGVYPADWYDLAFAGVCLLPPAIAHLAALLSGRASARLWMLWVPGIALFWMRPWNHTTEGWSLLWMTPGYAWSHAEALIRAGWDQVPPPPASIATTLAVSLVLVMALAVVVRSWYGVLDWAQTQANATARAGAKAGAGRAEGLPQARWANAREVRDNFHHPGGIVLGELTDPMESTPGFDPLTPRSWKRQGRGRLITMDPERGNGHVVVIAASAGGKTAGLVIPNILHYNGPLVVVDPKGDLYARTRAAREARGFGARVIDARHGFDPFKLIAPLAPATPSVYLTMAKTLMPIQSRASDISEYFHEMSTALFAALMAHFIEENSPNVAADISKFINRKREEVIGEALDIADEYNLPLINDEMAGLAALDERTFPGVVKGISNKLAFVRFPDVASYGTSERTPEDHIAALDPGTDIFINVPTLAAKDFSSFPRLLIGAMYVATELMQQPDRPDSRRLFLIDEARVLGGMDALTNVRDAGRSIGMHLMLIYQSLGQLKEAWGGEAGADAWLDSCEARVVGAVGAARTASDIATMLGRQTITTRTQGSSSSAPALAPMGGSVSSSEQEQIREVPLMSAATLGQLPAHGSIIFTRRTRPILATKALYFTRKDMKDKVLSADVVAGELEVTRRRKALMQSLAGNGNATSHKKTAGETAAEEREEATAENTAPEERKRDATGPAAETTEVYMDDLTAPVVAMAGTGGDAYETVEKWWSSPPAPQTLLDVADVKDTPGEAPWPADDGSAMQAAAPEIAAEAAQAGDGSNAEHAGTTASTDAGRAEPSASAPSPDEQDAPKKEGAPNPSEEDAPTGTPDGPDTRTGAAGANPAVQPLETSSRDETAQKSAPDLTAREEGQLAIIIRSIGEADPRVATRALQTLLDVADVKDMDGAELYRRIEAGHAAASSTNGPSGRGSGAGDDDTVGETAPARSGEPSGARVDAEDPTTAKAPAPGAASAPADIGNLAAPGSDGINLAAIDPAPVEIEEGEIRPDIDRALAASRAGAEVEAGVPAEDVQPAQDDAAPDEPEDPDQPNPDDAPGTPEAPQTSATGSADAEPVQSVGEVAIPESVAPQADVFNVPAATGEDTAQPAQGDAAPENPEGADQPNPDDAPKKDGAQNPGEETAQKPTASPDPEADSKAAEDVATGAQTSRPTGPGPTDATDQSPDQPARAEPDAPATTDAPATRAKPGARAARKDAPAKARAKARKPTPKDLRWRYDAEEVRAALDAMAESLFRDCVGEPRHPGAAEWRARSNGGFAMGMQGQYRGRWSDFKTGEHGSLLDLFAIHFCGLSEAGEDFPAVLEAAAHYAGLSASERRQLTPAEKTALTEAQAKARAEREAETARQDALRRTLIDRLRGLATPIDNTPAASYLRARGIADWPRVGLGWLPPLGQHLEPALLEMIHSPDHNALVVWARDGKTVMGGQRILLAPDGTRIGCDVPKPAFGRTGGLPARFATPVKPAASDPLIVAEGPETALAIRAATGFETWAVFGVSGWMRAPLPKARRVILAPDRDAPGSPAGKAFARAVAQHLERGIDLAIADAPEPEGSKKDLADTLQQQGPDAVKTALSHARDPRKAAAQDKAADAAPKAEAADTGDRTTPRTEGTDDG